MTRFDQIPRWCPLRRNLRPRRLLVVALAVLHSGFFSGCAGKQAADLDESANATGTPDKEIARSLAPAFNSIQAQDIQRHVDYLASDELKGRYYLSPEAHLAAEYIAKVFADAGLDAVDANGQIVADPDWRQYLQPVGPVKPLGERVPGDQSSSNIDSGIAPNVVAIKRALRSQHRANAAISNDAIGKDERFVLVTAHYDHLEPRSPDDERYQNDDDLIFNGADDNASGTAGVLEIAEALSLVDQESLDASIVVIAFTGEEHGFVGSKYFAEHGPIPMESIIGVLNLDMISRGEENLLYVEGAKDSSNIGTAIKQANACVGLHIEYDQHLNWLWLSDQAPFLRRDVPAVYIGVDYHDDYHQVTDHADRILAGLAERTTRVSFVAALDLAGVDTLN
jgi:hypothetical protein